MLRMNLAYDKPELLDYLYKDEDCLIRQKMDWVEPVNEEKLLREGWFQGLVVMMFGGTGS